MRYLVVDEQLHGVAAPLDEDQLIGLARDRVGEGGPEAGAPRPAPQPQADGEGEDLLQDSTLHAGVHVAGPHGEADLEQVRVLGRLGVGLR